jgi:hypothetical protein
MGAQVATQKSSYIIYDARRLPEADAVYEAAIKITDEIMEGIDRLAHSNTIVTATLFITTTGAQLVLLARSSDENLIALAFRSTLKTVTYDPDIGYLQKYTIPILES